MNKIYILTLLLTSFFSATAEKVTVQFEMSNIPNTSNRLMVYERMAYYNPLNKKLLQPDENGKDNYTVELESPQFLQLGFVVNQYDPTSYIRYILFLTPGDKLLVKVDFAKKGNEISVSGSGSQNNQPFIQKLFYLNCRGFMRDTLPYRILNVIKKQQAQNKVILKSYIKRYKPSSDFIKICQMDLQYFSINNYYSFKEENKRYIRDAYLRNYGKWNKPQLELMRFVKINNDNALTGYNYVVLMSAILQAHKSDQMDFFNENRIAFDNKWYPGGDDKKGAKLRNEENNIFVKKIIDQYFTGKTKEFLFAQLIKNNLYDGNLKNIDLLYNGFAKEYPNSKYLKYFQKPVAEAIRN